MADKTIGNLPAASAIYDDDLFLLEQSGEAKNLRGALYKAYLQGFADAAEAASEEAAAALAGVRDAINNIPDGAATPIVNDLTTGGTSMALSAEMGKVLGQRPNPNLLDNWYFVNPVNQRGQTEYSGTGYGIDRWRNGMSASAHKIASSGLIIYKTSTRFEQLIENAEDFVGKTLTLSALVVENTSTSNVTFGALVSGSSADTVVVRGGNVGCFSTTFAAKEGFEGVRFYTTSGFDGSVIILAAKLELGTQQTLAHQDADGNWVLNEIPDYNEQLLRCCMSTADSSDTYANNKRTPAAINAVPLDGSKAMTGGLSVNNGHGVVKAGNGSSQLEHYPTAGSATTNIILGIRAKDTLDKIARLYHTVDNATTAYNILHTGNKPSGSYTGNGDATKRTIETGGIGSVCEIHSLKGKALVTYYGAIVARGDTVFNVDANNVNFRNGVLSILTTDDAFNANSTTYYYNVL